MDILSLLCHFYSVWVQDPQRQGHRLGLFLSWLKDHTDPKLGYRSLMLTIHYVCSVLLILNNPMKEK